MRKIYVGNIPFNATEQDIRYLFDGRFEVYPIKCSEKRVSLQTISREVNRYDK